MKMTLGENKINGLLKAMAADGGLDENKGRQLLRTLVILYLVDFGYFVPCIFRLFRTLVSFIL